MSLSTVCSCGNHTISLAKRRKRSQNQARSRNVSTVPTTLFATTSDKVITPDGETIQTSAASQDALFRLDRW